MSDLGERADDYERRLASAGSTEAIIGGLVRSVDRGKRVIVLLVITLIVDLALSLTVAGVAVTAWTNTQNILANTVRMSDAAYKECLVNKRLVHEVSNVYGVLIEGANSSTLFTAAEKAARISRYRAAIPAPHVCTKL